MKIIRLIAAAAAAVLLLLVCNHWQSRPVLIGKAMHCFVQHLN